MAMAKLFLLDGAAAGSQCPFGEPCLQHQRFESFEGTAKGQRPRSASCARSPMKETRMSAEQNASLRGPLARLKVRTLVLEEKLAASLHLKSSASLPSRI